MAYARPVLCRLCGFPAPDGGVPVSQVDSQKLSEFCLRTMDTKMDQEGLEKAVICQFCMLDARFIQETGTNEDEILKNQIAVNLEKYISEDGIQRCAVRILTLPPEKETEDFEPLSTDTEEEDDAITNVYKCMYCSKAFSTKLDRNGHVSESHKDIPTFRCSLCFKFFRNKEEKHTHMKSIHGEKLLCVYCSITFENYDQKVSHFLKNHKDVSIQYKCSKNCNNLYFWTQAELEAHMRNVHKESRKLKKCLFCSKLFVFISSHLKTHHRAEAIKCNFRTNCNAYFHNDEEMMKHIDKIHRRADTRLKKPCIFCKRMVPSRSLAVHVKRMHRSEVVWCNFNQTCKKYFKFEEDRQKHILEVHTQKQEVVDVAGSCVYCNEMMSRDKISKHIKMLHSSVAIRCTFAKKCIAYFLSEEEKQKHVKEFHPKQKCHLCKKEYKYKTDLAIHMTKKHRGYKKLSDGNFVKLTPVAKIISKI